MRNCHKVLVSQFAFGWRVVDRRNHWTHRGADIITWIPRFPSQWNHCISISNDSCTPSVKHFHFAFKKRQTQTQTKQLRKNYWDNQRQKTSASERSARVHRITHLWGGCNRIERLNGKCHIFSKVVVVCTSVASFFGHVRVRCSIAVSYGKMDSKRHVKFPVELPKAELNWIRMYRVLPLLCRVCHTNGGMFNVCSTRLAPLRHSHSKASNCYQTIWSKIISLYWVGSTIMPLACTWEHTTWKRSHSEEDAMLNKQIMQSSMQRTTILTKTTTHIPCDATKHKLNVVRVSCTYIIIC